MATAFRGKACGGGTQTADSFEVRRALALLADPLHGIEIRTLPTGKSRVFAGSDLDGMVQYVDFLTDYAGVYYTLNPIPAGLDHPARVGDVLVRRWLLIDVDPVRPADTSTTDGEHELAHRKAEAVAAYLDGQQWPAPVVIDSGNGWHLLYRIDLPANDLARVLCRSALVALAQRFDDDAAKVDRSVHNASRIAKLPGTWARKGPSTSDRPHRLCRLISVPDPVGVVTAAQIGALAGPVEPVEEPAPDGGPLNPPAEETPFRGRATSGEGADKITRARAYLRTIPGAVSGQEGHKETFIAALKVVRGFDLTDAEATTVLSEWNQTCQPPWTAKELKHKIEDAQKAKGKRGNLLNDPERNGTSRGKANDPPKRDPSIPLTVKMSQVVPLTVQWLMRNRIARRFITVMAGRTGIGKSFVACDLIARISRGGEIPFSNGERFPVGGTLIISEDSHEYVLAPRLIDAGADMNRINAMTWAAMGQYNLGDIGMLDDAANEVEGGPTVVVIDPPTNFLEGTDEHKNSEVRQLVMKIVEWALGRDVAVLFILHVNKNAKGVEALNRVMGSVAWVTTARIAHTFCTDPNDPDRALWVPMKNNLGPKEKAIAYKIIKTDDGTRVEWVEEVDITADAAMNNERAGTPRFMLAQDWLVELFTQKLEWSSDDFWASAKQHGVKKPAIDEARVRMKMPKPRQVATQGGDRSWIWWVPADWPYLPQNQTVPQSPPQSPPESEMTNWGKDVRF